tara:strand:+ start:546 stop:2891 length:2346 start_codon:yes stop_codon:yes gene_type:complete
MANITQQIPNFLGGFSQEPDYQKPVNTVSEMINGYPDLTAGLSKRPGSKFIKKLSGITSVTGYKYFEVEHANESYIAAVGGGTVKVWKTETGDECTVVTTNAATGYLNVPTGTEAHAAFKTTSFEKATIICNTTVTAAASSTTNSGTLDNHYEKQSLDDLHTGSTGNAETDIYTIRNTNSELDDIFVQWNGYSFVEVLGYDTISGGSPVGISVGLDNTTLPHILEVTGVVNNLPTWEVKKIDYSNRTCGNNTTNPQPSFVGQTISNVFTYLNRVGFLSGSNVIMSRPVTPDNTSNTQSSDVDFYFESTLTVSDADPVDINVASTSQLKLHSVAKVREGLVLFSDLEQLLLFSENGIITPKSVDVRGLSNWSSNTSLDAIEIGDQVFFLSGESPFNQYSRLIRMIPQGINQTPVFDEVSRTVNEWLPLSISNIATSPQEQLLVMSDITKKKMWCYRVFKRDGQIIDDAWFEWDFNGEIAFTLIRNSTVYFITEISNNVVLQKMSLQVTPLENVVDADDPNPYIDVIAIPTTVTSTQITPPTGWPVDVNYNVVAFVLGDKQVVLNGPIDGNPETGGCTGTYADLQDIQGSNIDLMLNSVITDTPTVCYSLRNGANNIHDLQTGQDTIYTTNLIGGYVADLTYNSSASKYDCPVDLSDKNIVIGYKYDMSVKLPNIYFRNNNFVDYSAYTIISRVKITAKLSGAISFTVNQQGRPEGQRTLEVTDAGFYQPDVIPVVKERLFELPIHLRNDAFILSITSNTAFPITLNSMMWEGQYMPRSYRRL